MAKVNNKSIEAAIKQTGGNISEVARALGVARVTVYRRIAKSPTLKQALEDEREALVDLAEGVIKTHLKQSNLIAAMFTLKTQGKARGWVERAELTGADGGPVEVIGIEVTNIVNKTDDD